MDKTKLKIWVTNHVNNDDLLEEVQKKILLTALDSMSNVKLNELYLIYKKKDEKMNELAEKANNFIQKTISDINKMYKEAEKIKRQKEIKNADNLLNDI